MRSCLFVLVPLLLLACPRDPRATRSPDVVAYAGDDTINRSSFATELAQAGVARLPMEDRSRVAEAILQRMIDWKLLLQMAEKSNILVDDAELAREIASSAKGYLPGEFERTLHAEQLTTQGYRQEVKERLLIEKYIRQNLKFKSEVSEDEMRARYKSHVAGRKMPAAVHARHVMVLTQEEANHIKLESDAGRMSIAEAARRYSDSPDASRAGDLGFIVKGDMPSVFDVVFTMKPGEKSAIVPSKSGKRWNGDPGLASSFHIFECIEVRPERTETFEEAQMRLVDDIQRERQTQARKALLDQSRAAAKIEIFPEAVKSALLALPLPKKPSEEKPLDETKKP